MKKFISIFIAAVLVLAFGCGFAYTESEPSYDPNVDYMSLMIRYAALGDMDNLATAIEARNAKIADTNSAYKAVSKDEFLKNYEAQMGFKYDTDYSLEMKRCCINGDIEGGRAAELKRNKKLAVIGYKYNSISFDDMYLLSKIITAEAGSYWLPIEWRMSVGEVLLNRVASPEFPNTIYECVYQPGQYYGVYDYWFANLTPYESCVDVAFKLLMGERCINEPSAVFQANFPQGGGVCRAFYDDALGYTYICYTSNPELY